MASTDDVEPGLVVWVSVFVVSVASGVELVAELLAEDLPLPAVVELVADPLDNVAVMSVVVLEDMVE